MDLKMVLQFIVVLACIALGARKGGVALGLWGGVGLLLMVVIGLVVGALPFWERLRAQPRVRAALMGINAAVVGLLLAALWNPVITSGIRGMGDALLAAVALLALMKWKWPPWAVVAGCATIGWAMAA